MLEARLYKVLVLVTFLTAIYLGLPPRTALMRTGVIISFVFVSDWLTSFVLP